MSRLATLVAGAEQDAQQRAARVSLDAVIARAETAPPVRDAVVALAPGERVKIIAEIKRASPSRGDLAEIPEPVHLAEQYQIGGASAISVLTEGRSFKGSLADLQAVSAAVQIPVLRKDFIVNEYQVYEARAAGADLVLLIAAALDQDTLRRLHSTIVQLGMTPLVEAHSADEVRRAVDVGAAIIGVNARDLVTFTLDRDLFGTLAEQIPEGTIRVAESAVLTPSDVLHYRSAGADAVLIGEALVTGDPVRTLQTFLEPR